MSVRKLFKIMEKVNVAIANDSYYCFLRCIVEHLRPTTIVELGTDRGASALIMLSALKTHGHIYTIDIKNKFPIIHEQITKIISNDIEVDVNELPEIDFLFIDSEHTAEHVSKQLDLYLPRVKINGIVVIDDIKVGDMPKIWESILYPKMYLNYLHKSGFGMFIKDEAWKLFGTPLDTDPPVIS